MPEAESELTLMLELMEMPEYRLSLELQAFETSLYIFDGNFADLDRLISFAASDPRCAELFEVRNRDKLKRLGREILRLYHNFVASAMSLVDHSRRMYDKLHGGPERFPDYEQRASELGRDPLCQFVKCLRNYCQHYKAPNLTFTVSFEGEDGCETRAVGLLVTDLWEFDGWTNKAKEFLTAAGKRVDLGRVANDYRDKVTAFHEWFRCRQAEIHAEELSRFRDQEARILLLEMEQCVDACLANRASMPYRGEEVFLHVFASGEFEYLERFAPASPDRGERAIHLLERRLPISSVLVEKIRLLYSEPAFVSKLVYHRLENGKGHDDVREPIGP